MANDCFGECVRLAGAGGGGLLYADRLVRTHSVGTVLAPSPSKTILFFTKNLSAEVRRVTDGRNGADPTGPIAGSDVVPSAADSATAGRWTSHCGTGVVITAVHRNGVDPTGSIAGAVAGSDVAPTAAETITGLDCIATRGSP